MSEHGEEMEEAKEKVEKEKMEKYLSKERERKRGAEENCKSRVGAIKYTGKLENSI